MKTWPIDVLGVKMNWYKVTVRKGQRFFTTKSSALMPIDAKHEVMRKLPYEWWGATITVEEV